MEISGKCTANKEHIPDNVQGEGNFKVVLYSFLLINIVSEEAVQLVLVKVLHYAESFIGTLGPQAVRETGPINADLRALGLF